MTTPLVQAQLAAKGLKPIPASVRPALRRAMQRELAQTWRVVSVEKVPSNPAVGMGMAGMRIASTVRDPGMLGSW